MNFDDTQYTFAHQSTADLQMTACLLEVARRPRVAEAAKAALNLAMSLHLPVDAVLRRTVFKVFCGGETLEECQEVSRRLRQKGIQSAINYAVEDSDSNQSVAAESYRQTKDLIRQLAIQKPAYAVLKPTSLVTSGALKSYQERPQPKSVEEIPGWNYFVDLAECAEENQVPLMIDAEESWLQDAIDDIVLALMRRFNRQNIVIYHTIQCYRHDRDQYMAELLALAKAEGFGMGLKLVRGAYLEQENERAQKLGVASPLFASKEDTDRCFDRIAQLSVANFDQVTTCVGTQNEASVHKVVEHMKELGISPSSQRVFFSQLLGMSDTMTFELARQGYTVCKFIPFGPIRRTVPYLLRRLEENTSVLERAERDLAQIKQEIRRRRTH